jgi:hypothetical protein
MAWHRGTGLPAYYRSVRAGRRVRRVYVGTGLRGALAAAEDACRREQRRALAQARRAEKGRWAEADAQLNRFIRLTDMLSRAALMTAGFFRHCRGEWRRRRAMPTTTETTTGPATDSDPPGLSEALATQELEQLVLRAEQGDKDVLPALRQALDAHPEVWQNYCQLGAMAEAAWLQMMAGDNVMMFESWRRQVEQLKAEVAGESASPLERLLAGRVGAAWLQVQCADAGGVVVQGGRPADEATALRRQDAAHRRLLGAIKTLAVVRRLLRPPVSPVEVASRLGAGQPSGGRRASSPAGGVGVLN